CKEKGKIVAMDKPSKLVKKAKSPYVISFEAPEVGDKIKTELGKLGEVTGGKTGEHIVRLSKKDNLAATLQLIADTKPTALSVRPASLEDIFIELTGNTLTEEKDA